MNTRAWLVTAIGAACLLAGCRLPGTYCNDNEECPDGMVCSYTLCMSPCSSSADCSGHECLADGRCGEALRDAGGIDAGPIDAGAIDAGPPDGGPVDGGVDAGGCGADEVRCSAVCVEAAVVDGNLVPSATSHCGACDLAAPVCDDGVPRACSLDVPCASVANGAVSCADGSCVLSCNPGYAECPDAPGACTSTETLSDCGACGDDVTGIATSCADGVPKCGTDDACAADGGASLCAEASDGTFGCVACTADEDCGAGFCCQGACYDDDERDSRCGCAAQVGAASGEDCSSRTTERKCVSGVCGCDADGTAQCGSDGVLHGLCADASVTTGTCLMQDGANCGVVGGVRTADGAEVQGASCDVTVGGAACIDADADEVGECGCTGATDCTGPVLVGGVPRVSASTCTADECMCGSAAACGEAAPDCAGVDGCRDFQSATFHCGVPANNCADGARGLDDGSGTCVSGGCRCDAPSDCTAPANVNNCSLVVGVGNACVCFFFTDVAGGALLACPMGLPCTNDGCEYEGTGYATLEALNQALGL